MFHTNRTFDVLYTGYENDGSTVIDADLPVGACVCTVEGASSIDSETGLQKVTRPATANLVRARKLIVAASDNLINVNSIPNASAPTKRKGGVVTVYDPCHPANQEVYALCATSVEVYDSLVPADGSFALVDNDAADAADIEGAIVAYARTANASGSNALTKVRLMPQ